MKTEAMENNPTTSIFEQEIPVKGKLQPIIQILEERVTQEVEERLNSPKYKLKYEDPSAPSAQPSVRDYIKGTRCTGEEEFMKLKKIIKEDELDSNGYTDNTNYQTYQALQNGEKGITTTKERLSNIRGVFAQANIKLNQKLKGAVTRENLYTMIKNDLFKKRMEDYQYLVWQLF